MWDCFSTCVITSTSVKIEYQLRATQFKTMAPKRTKGMKKGKKKGKQNAVNRRSVKRKQVEFTFRELWWQLKKKGWSSQRGKGLESRWSYVKPNKSSKDAAGIDFFIGEQALMDYAHSSGLYEEVKYMLYDLDLVSYLTYLKRRKTIARRTRK